ncbi:hypothetical protein MD484_g4343, partial [Candolleomyces efflorescens]
MLPADGNVAPNLPDPQQAQLLEQLFESRLQEELAKRDINHQAHLQQQISALSDQYNQQWTTQNTAETVQRESEHQAQLQQQFNQLTEQYHAQWTTQEATLRAEQQKREQELLDRLRKLEEQVSRQASVAAPNADDDSEDERKRKPYQLLTRDVPKDCKNVQAALTLHIRILWGLTDTKALPGKPSADIIKRFDERFATTDAISNQKHSNSLLISVNHVRGAFFLSTTTHARNTLVNTIRKMEEHIIQYIDSYLARFGLEEWRPDFAQSPYSLYNATLRIIALDTFKQALVSHAYAFLKPNLAYANDTNMLVKLYDHIVHFYFQGRYTRDARNPGAVQAVDDANSVYRNRARLAKARRKWLTDNGYPRRYRELITPKATSDDERDPEQRKINGRPLYFIKARPERSAKVTRFLRILDAKREASARVDPDRRWKERVRQEPATVIPTAFPSIPKHMPVDYFDPNYFNHLPPKLRAKAAVYRVALLPEVEDSFSGCADEKLTDLAFDEIYAATVAAPYQMVDDIDLILADSEEEEHDDDVLNAEEEEEEEDFYEDEDAALQRGDSAILEDAPSF